MKHHAANLFPLVLMGFLAALTFWLQRTAQPDDQRPGKLRHDPDFYADAFTVKRFDASGALQHTVTARHMKHYADDGSTEIFDPAIVYHKGKTTRITADNAVIDEKGEKVLLTDNVHIQHHGSSGAMEMRTSSLTVFPETEIAHTEAPVTVSQGQSVIRGIGLDVDNKTKKAVLGGRVHGTIYSEPR